MYIEKRANGTYYLRESKWDPKLKQTVSTVTYLGRNACKAHAKLAILTQNEDLLYEMAHIYDCDELLVKIIKSLENHKKSCDYININCILEHCIISLERLWAVGNNEAALQAECLRCRHYCIAIVRITISS
ncbi:MAG TPA: hypothetical protein PKA28_14465 [Methylomusa anaerophila]|uniref:Uncharacterized protein n=1 Tax=Methylomusa anaerophila TaxID=1930071 RepID=A0A348AET4_9FIRM|nr:hypothetical protein [Methylomusa anaerophila]BBB89582.1 hypothetical protein MAMMFC1_00215 [Methylomusa anaerophila]HML89644.1 hypothetical protein [Methylomusa anaerophila]